MSTDDDDAGLDAARLAADPRTDWETLHRIAEDHPGLRAEIAANPNTYPELLDALGALGDPQVDAALASRESPPAGNDWAEGPKVPAMDSETGQFQALMDESAEEITDELMIPDEDYYPGYAQSQESVRASYDRRASLGNRAGVQEATGGAQSRRPAGAFGQDAESKELLADDATGHASSPPPSRPAVERFELPAREPETAREESNRDDAALGAALPAATGTGAAGAGGGPAGAMLSPASTARSRSGSGAGMLALAILLPIVAVVAIGALIMVLVGEDDQPAAGGPSEGQEQQQPEASADGDEGETGAEDQELALAEARSAVQQLPESTTCEDPSEDAQAVAGYAALAAETGVWGAEDEELLEFTFEDLQEACDVSHAAGVFHTLRGDTGSSEALTASLDEVGIGWADTAFDAPDAQTMDSFVTPDGNVLCEWEDGVRCTVLDFEYTPPSGCEDATTYSLTVDGAGTACDDPVEESADLEPLDHDQAAAIGVLACLSLEDRVSCYNMIDGSGFELSERGHYTY